jgi:hypothetical protein
MPLPITVSIFIIPTMFFGIGLIIPYAIAAVILDALGLGFGFYRVIISGTILLLALFLILRIAQWMEDFGIIKKLGMTNFGDMIWIGVLEMIFIIFMVNVL